MGKINTFTNKKSGNETPDKDGEKTHKIQPGDIKKHKELKLRTERVSETMATWGIYHVIELVCLAQASLSISCITFERRF